MILIAFIARLFGGRVDPAASRRATRRRRPLPQRTWATFPLPQHLVGVPDPVFWKVMEYWRLGDWRRPSDSDYYYSPTWCY